MDEQSFCTGVIHRVHHLFVGEPNVHGVQNGSDHRHRKETFQIAVTIVVEYSDTVTRLDSEFAEQRSELLEASVERCVRNSTLIAVDDFLMRCPGKGASEKRTEDQGLRVSGLRIIRERHGKLRRSLFGRGSRGEPVAWSKKTSRPKIHRGIEPLDFAKNSLLNLTVREVTILF